MRDVLIYYAIVSTVAVYLFARHCALQAAMIRGLQRSELKRAFAPLPHLHLFVSEHSMCLEGERIMFCAHPGCCASIVVPATQRSER